MVHSYRDDKRFHELVFLLQFAAALSVLLQNVGFALDIGTRKGLGRMKAIAVVQLAIVLYSRVFRYAVVGLSLLKSLRASGSFFVLPGMASIVMLGIFNALMVMDAVTKVAKFLPMQIQRHSVAEIRSSSIRLQTSLNRMSSLKRVYTMTPAHKRWQKLRGAVAVHSLLLTKRGGDVAPAAASHKD
jgi:hypothetical protein